MPEIQAVPLAGQLLIGLCALVVLGLLLRGALGRALQQGLERVQNVCAMLVQKGLHPEALGGRLQDREVSASVTKDGEELEQEVTQEQQSTGSEVFMLVTRLLGFFLAVDVLFALYIIDAKSVPLVIFGGESGSGVIQVPISVPTVMGILSWAMAALQGAFLFEVLGVIPASAQFLMPLWQKTTVTRVFFRVGIGLANVLLMLYVALVGLVASFELKGIPWLAGSIAARELQIILVHITALASLWLVVLGISALFALLCLLVRLLCAVVQLFLKHWVQPAKDVAWKPDTETTGVDEDQGPIVNPRQVAPYQTTLIAAGESGRRTLHTVAQAQDLLRGKNVVRLLGYTPIERAPGRPDLEAIRTIGGRNIGNTPTQVAVARERGGDETEYLLDQVQRMIQQYTPRVTGNELTLVGLDYELVASASQPLAHLKAALPRQLIVPVVELPAGSLGKPEVQVVLRQLAELWGTGQIGCTVLVDRHRRGTGTRGRDQQGRMLGHSLSGLMLAHQHAPENPTGAKLLGQLGKETPFVCLTTDIIALPPGDPLRGFDAGRLIHGKSRGAGNIEQTRGSMSALAQRLLHDETARLFPAPLTQQPGRLAGEIFMNFDKRNPRFRDVCEGVENWVAQNIPGAELMFVAGPGARESSRENHYRGQWCWWYGVTLDELLGQRQAPPQDLQAQVPQRKSSSTAPRTRTASAGRAANGSQSAIGRKRGRRTPLRVVTGVSTDIAADTSVEEA